MEAALVTLIEIASSVSLMLAKTSMELVSVMLVGVAMSAQKDQTSAI
jgi:hypothetical protein